MTGRQDSSFIKIWKCTICRITIIIFTCLLVLLFILSIVANPILNLFVKPGIIQSINNNEKINFNTEMIDFSLFQNRILAYNTSLSITDSSNSNTDTIKFFVPIINVSGINWFNLLIGKGYSFGDLLIQNPRFEISSYINPVNNNSDKEDSTTEESSFAESIAGSLPGSLKPLRIGSLEITSANLVRLIDDGERTIDSVKNLSLLLDDIAIDDEETNNPIFKNFRLSIDKVKTKMSGSGYNFSIDSINISQNKSNLSLKNLTLKPYISDNEFFKGDKYRKDRLILKIPEIELIEPDFIKFFNQNLFSVKEISVPEFHIEIFTNRRLPIDPNSRPDMPHELVSSLGFKLEAEKIETKNSIIILESVMPEVEKRARLELTNVQASISNLSNTNKQTDKKPFTIEASGKLMGEGNMQIKLKYNLSSENLNFSYEGFQDEMQLNLLNSHLEVEDKTQLKSGKIIKANFKVNVNNGISKVNLIPLYQNLEIEVLEEESIEGLWFPTLIAGYKIRASNPDEEGKIKSANVSYTKKPTDTFMDVIWLSILQGIGEVVGF